MKVRDVIKVVEQTGWHQIRMKGSHRIFAHPERKGIVVIPGHLGDDIPIGTLRAILRQAGLEKQ